MGADLLLRWQARRCARACKEVSDHSKFVAWSRRQSPSSCRHEVERKMPGQDLIQPLFDFRAHNDPVPIFRIADAFCVAGFDEPVNDGR